MYRSLSCKHTDIHCVQEVLTPSAASDWWQVGWEKVSKSGLTGQKDTQRETLFCVWGFIFSVNERTSGAVYLHALHLFCPVASAHNLWGQTQIIRHIWLEVCNLSYISMQWPEHTQSLSQCVKLLLKGLARVNISREHLVCVCVSECLLTCRYAPWVFTKWVKRGHLNPAGNKTSLQTHALRTCYFKPKLHIIWYPS